MAMLCKRNLTFDSMVTLGHARCKPEAKQGIKRAEMREEDISASTFGGYALVWHLAGKGVGMQVHGRLQDISSSRHIPKKERKPRSATVNLLAHMDCRIETEHTV